MIGIMNITPASVLVVENHPLMREALCAALADEPDLKVGMQAVSGVEVLQMMKIVLPDIVIFALGNPELSELKALHESLPETPILALTSDEMPEQEQAALEAGAQAVLTKAASRDEVINALREIYKNSVHDRRSLEQEVIEDTVQ